MEVQATMIWQGLQVADALLAKVREGDAVIIGDVVPSVPGGRTERLPVNADTYDGFSLVPDPNGSIVAYRMNLARELYTAEATEKGRKAETSTASLRR